MPGRRKHPNVPAIPIPQVEPKDFIAPANPPRVKRPNPSGIKYPLTVYKRKPKPGYTVKQGDTLFSLSRKWATTVRDIARLNKIKDPNKIKIGDRLRKPAMTRMPPVAVNPRTGKPKVL